MEQMLSAYVCAMMTYIKLEYDNIPEEVTPEMEEYFSECFLADPPVCLPNASGFFYERFLRSYDI